MKQPSPSCRFCLALAGSVFFFSAVTPVPRAQVSVVRRATFKLARLTEETLPPEEMPASATATPAPSPAEVGAPASPASSRSTEAGTGVPPTSISPEEIEPGSEVAPGSNTEPKAEGAAAEEAQPGSPEEAGAAPAASASPPPPLEVGTVRPELRVSDAPLGAVIGAAQSPSTAASLRIADQARENILGNRPDDAIQMLMHALSVDPTNWYAYFYLGRASLAKHDYSQAIAFFNRAETGFGSNAEWLSETLAFEGLTYEESGKTAEAEAAYQGAMRAEPGNLMARVGYTRLAGENATTLGAEPGATPGTSDMVPPTGVSSAPPPEEPPPAPAPEESPLVQPPPTAPPPAAY